MGGHSCYCAICGGPFGDIAFSPPHPPHTNHPDVDQPDTLSDSSQDEEVDIAAHDDVAWSGAEDNDDDNNDDDDDDEEDAASDDTDSNSPGSEHNTIELSDDEPEDETVETSAQIDGDPSEAEESQEDLDIILGDMAPSEGSLDSADEQMPQGNDLILDGFQGFVLDENHWEDEPGSAYDRKILKPRHAQWIKTLYVIGCNTEAPGPSKCYLSGRGVAEFYMGTVDFTPGPIRLRDPNYPRIKGRRRPLPHIPTFIDWTFEAPLKWVFPVHMPCLKILCQTLTGRPDPYNNPKLDKDALFFAFNSLSDQLGGALNITYFPDQTRIPQYWESVPGNEHRHANPLSKESPYSKQVLDLVSNAIKASQERRPQTADIAHKVKSDVFRKLPYDLIYSITRLLPDKDLFALCSASHTVHMFLDNNEQFWRLRLTKISMPWFEEAMAALAEEKLPPRDWKVVMRNLQEILCNHGKQGVLMGVYNRKRIWGCCQTIAPAYFEKLREVEEDGAEVLVERLEEFCARERNGGLYHEGEGFYL